ncbi:hypothetical protein EBB59_05845 [Lysobacter pythonis]|uniref:Uncharacterized protein n=2 Tax=Solilutibacter pythonis TaxID=2483112 RepID=A0A3M2HWG9_9GAMM|nr:hypothetical protein EBB59_05845 [Lysobacter pythonis]
MMAPTILAAGFGLGALAMSQQVQAQEPPTRVLVDIEDVILHDGQPYYRHGDYGLDERLIVEHDRHGRPRYYRVVDSHYGNPPYGNAYGYYRNGQGSRARCNRNGKCVWYTPRYDYRSDYRHHDYRVYDDYARRYSRGW